MAIRHYRDLEVWQLAMDLTVEIYRITEDFPKSEQYGLTSQLRRSAVSVPSNIAEGHGRETTRDYLRFLSIAMGSIAEVETQLTLGKRLTYASPDVVDGCLEQYGTLGRRLRTLQKSLQSKLPSP